VKLPIPLLPHILRWAGVLIVAAIIFYGSLITTPETVVDDTRPFFFELNHWRHLVAYFTLACSLAYATTHWNIPRLQNAALVIAIAAAYGIAMEAGQAFVPHRSDFLISDAIVNTIGASGVLLWYSLERYIEWQPLPEFLDTLSSLTKNS